MMSTLYKTNTLSWIFIVLVHLNNSLCCYYWLWQGVSIFGNYGNCYMKCIFPYFSFCLSYIIIICKFFSDTLIVIYNNYMYIFQTLSYLSALSQLNHSNTDLTHAVWIDLFPRIWKILSDKQQQVCRLYIQMLTYFDILPTFWKMWKSLHCK